MPTPLDEREKAESGAEPKLRPNRIERWELVSLGLILVVFVAAGLHLVLARPPLGHDEAVYALRARYYAGEGSALGYWNPYRAVGLPLLARLVWPIGDSDVYLRTLVLAISASGILVTWAWGRRFFGARAALLAAVVLATTPTYLMVGYLIYVDVPAAVFGMAAVLTFALAIASAEKRGSGLPWWVVFAVPIAAFATASRYGAPVLIAPGMTIVGLAYWRTLLRLFWQVALLAVGMVVPIWLILFVPEVTGSSRPPYDAFRQLADSKKTTFWAPYADLFDILPDVFGWVVGILVVMGLLSAIVFVIRGELPRRDALVALVAIPAFVVFLNLNLPFVMAQYVVPVLPFVAIASAAGLAALTRRLPKAGVMGLVVLILAVGSACSYPTAADYGEWHVKSYQALRDTGGEIRARFGSDCVVMTSYVQVGWYSTCKLVSFPADAAPSSKYPERLGPVVDRALREGGVTCEASVVVVIVSNGKRQPVGEALDALRRQLGPPLFIAGGSDSVRPLEVGVAGTIAEVTGDSLCRGA